MDTELLALDRDLPGTRSASRLEQLLAAIGKVLVELQVLWVILVRHSNGGQAPGILHVGVERDAVRRHGQRGRVAVRSQRAIVVLLYPALEPLSPPRCVRRQTLECPIDRREIEPEVISAAADEAEFAIELVGVPDDATGHDSLEAVHLVLERAGR